MPCFFSCIAYVEERNGRFLKCSILNENWDRDTLYIIHYAQNQQECKTPFWEYDLVKHDQQDIEMARTYVFPGRVYAMYGNMAIVNKNYSQPWVNFKSKLINK